jgi:S-adenosylmethionine:tRNA ribosyltransferase-isomerase
MLVSDFNYELPEELIAQQPAPNRSGSRMLALDRRSGHWQDSSFVAFPQMLQTGDVLVLNNSRVIPARLFAHRLSRNVQQPREPGKIEVLLTEQLGEDDWKTLVKPGKKVPVGERLRFLPRNITYEGEWLEAEVIERGEFGERILRFASGRKPFFQLLEAFGHIPLPPYIRHEDSSEDRERYQTVYADQAGSVAVPTAGLHFTPAILDQLRERGVQICYVTLHVGLGTFQPLRVDRVEDVKLHAERYTLPEETAHILNDAKTQRRRIIAAGTTTVRTLEHCAQEAGRGPLTAHSGSTSIFISPGYQFQLVDGLLTNFHLPQSSLLMLVSAFAGVDQMLAAYRHAVADRYRFFSYGDCMFIS